MKIAFRNNNGLRDEKRKLKNGLSPKVTAQVAALNGSTVYGAAKLRNASGPNTAPNVPQPTIENPPTKEAGENTVAKQNADLEMMDGKTPCTCGQSPCQCGHDTANPKSGTPAVGPDGKTITNAKKTLPAFIQKQIDAKNGDALAKKKVKNSVYPSIRGNYHSALSAMRVKLANSEMGDDDAIMNIDLDDDDDDANTPSGQDNQPAATIIYGDQDLTTPAAELVVTTQAPSVQ
jgi:hypothetical protein